MKAGMELKLHGARRLTIRAWDALKQTQGSVVFMSGSATLNPKPAFAAVAATNATTLAKAFAEQGVKDSIFRSTALCQARSHDSALRRSFLEKWAASHDITFDDAMKKFPEGTKNQPLRPTRRDRRTLGVRGFAGGKVDDGHIGPHGRRRDQRHLEPGARGFIGPISVAVNGAAALSET